MKKKFLLLIGNELGIKVLNKLNSYANFDIKIFSSNKDLVRKKIKFLKSKKHFITELARQKQKYDFLISVYFPWLIPRKLFNKFNNSINFHPSYLPIARGWYPHVHAILKNLKWGVTLHKISPGIDNGDIWCQKDIKFDEISSATELHQKGKLEILKLFNKNFLKIINGKVEPKKQSGKATYFNRNSVKKYDELKLNKYYNLKDLIKLNSARTFKNKSFNFFRYKNKEYSFKISIKKISNEKKK